MGDHRGGPAFAFGAGAQFGAQFLVEDEGQPHLFDRHISVEKLITRTPHRAHAAAAYRLEEPVARG
ncbi:hypothetical protein HerbRD11066_44330 [Herbidospora sp. RD11066]